MCTTFTMPIEYFPVWPEVHWFNLMQDAEDLGPPAGEVTLLLRAWSNGDRSVEERLFEIVSPDLRNLARYFLRGERAGHSLEPTVLLNEAYVRLVGARERDWENRKHFFAIAARVMRRLLIDRARARAQGRQVPIDGLEEVLAGRETQIDEALAVDQLLVELEAIHPDWCSLVELRFFLGCTEEEAADALGLPLRTAQRQFADARRWLYERLEKRPCTANQSTTNL